MQNLYETLLIVTPEADEVGVNAVIGDLRATIEGDGGTVLQAGVWERRKLAYAVKGKTEGIYVLIYADGNNTLPAVLKNRMKLDEAVIRSIVLRLEDLQEADARQKIAEADHTEDAARAEAQRLAAEKRRAAEAAATAMSLDEIVAAQEAESAAMAEGAEGDVEAQPTTDPGADDADGATAAGGGVDPDVPATAAADADPSDDPAADSDVAGPAGSEESDDEEGREG